MQWGRQLVSRGANGRQLTTPFFRNVQKDENMNNSKFTCYVLATVLFMSACNESCSMAQSPKGNGSSNVVKDGQTAIYHGSEEETIVVPYRPGYIDEDKVYDVVDVMPQFPGGYEKLKDYLEDNMQYPKKLKGSGIRGRAVVTFVVEKDGKISKAKVVRGIDPALDKEALRLIKKMPKWIPGKQNWIPVKVRYTIPITFKEQS